MFSPRDLPGVARAGLFPLQVRGLTLAYGATPVLRDVSFDLPGQGVTAILGPNGAGKSQLLRLLHGLQAPDAGQIDWAGLPPDQARLRQALVFQRPVLLRRSVLANVVFVLKARGGNLARAADLLDHVGLAHKADQPARKLSGGEAQRLALARALACDPQVLFLDEPTASLDPASVLAIEALVQQARDAGTRIVLVTHDIGQARRLADDVLFLHRGRLLEQAPAQVFFDQPQSAVARDFLAGRIPV